MKMLPCPAGAAILVFGSFVCAFTDILQGKIFNGVVFPLLVVVLVANILTDWVLPGLRPLWGTIGFGWSALGITACFLAMFLPYALGEVGAGDVKLAMLLGAVFGAHQGLVTLCIAIIVAAVFGITLAVSRYGFGFLHGLVHRSLTEVLNSTEQNREDKKKKRFAIPLAPAFFLAITTVQSRLCEPWIWNVLS